MKKIIALLLSLILILATGAALADEADNKTELGILRVGDAFLIQSKIPEGYKYQHITESDLNIIGLLIGEENAPVVTVSIAFNEEYEGVERFNDVDDETVEDIKDSFLEMDDVSFEDLETAYGTRLLKVICDNKSFVDIYTIYKGYELEFILTAQGEVQDADVQMLVDFISDMDFVPAN